MQLATLISVDYKYDNSISFFLLIPSSFHNIEPDKRHLASCRRYELLNTRPRNPRLCIALLSELVGHFSMNCDSITKDQKVQPASHLCDC